MVLFRKGINGKLILLFGLPGIIVAFLAARLPTLLPETQLKHLLGIFLVGYVIFLLAKPKWRLSKTNLNAVLGGSLSGLGAALFGTGGAIRGAFLSAFNLDKGMYLFTSGAIGLLIDSSRLIGYHTGGINLTTYSSLTLFFSVLIASFGAFLAKRFVTKIPQAKFRYLVTLALFGIGLRYIFL